MRIIQKTTASHLLVGLLMISCCGIVGCSGMFGGGYSITGGPGPLVKADLSAQASPGFAASAYNEVVVLPIEATSQDAASSLVLESLTRGLIKAFDVNTSISLLNLTEQNRFASALQELDSGNRGGIRPGAFEGEAVPHQIGLGRAAQLGSKLGTQAALYGVVSRFSGRDDGKTSSKSESVAFRLWLVEPSTSRVLWTATYERSDQALSENLFAVGANLKHVGYHSAEDMAREGFNQAATALEKLRATQ